VRGATNCKGDSRTVAVSRATPVILTQIVKRLTADRTEFCGGVVVLAAHENVGDLVIGGEGTVAPVEPTCSAGHMTARVPRWRLWTNMKSLCRLHFRVKEIQQSIAVIGGIRSCARLRIQPSVWAAGSTRFLGGLASSRPSVDGSIRSFCRERILE
jgi:hypothetical protein